MKTKTHFVLIMVLSLSVPGCRKGDRSYSISSCARCGHGYRWETRSGTTTEKLFDTDISPWLSRYRTGTCRHVWIPGAGLSNGMYWRGVNHWDTCLRQIKKLDPEVGEAVTRELLKRYYDILEAACGPKEGEESTTLVFDSEIDEKLKQFSAELKSRVDKIAARQESEINVANE